MRPKSNGSSPTGMKKSVVATRACWSFSRQTAASSEVSVLTIRLGNTAAAGVLARISRSTAGASLQPQPPPWAREVSRTGSDTGLLLKARRFILNDGREVPYSGGATGGIRSSMSRIQPISSADSATLAAFGTIIDVRSPSEFALDHVPGAINLPVLTDAERAEVGTIYVQESRLKANRIGAAYVARNIAGYLVNELADQPQSFAPLVYCWRGGSRSESMATILSRVGWRTSLLVGGYRTYRRHVQARLYDETWPLNLVLLDGDTGTGKTRILAGRRPPRRPPAEPEGL